MWARARYVVKSSTVVLLVQSEDKHNSLYCEKIQASGRERGVRRPGSSWSPVAGANVDPLEVFYVTLVLFPISILRTLTHLNATYRKQAISPVSGASVWMTSAASQREMRTTPCCCQQRRRGPTRRAPASARAFAEGPAHPTSRRPPSPSAWGSASRHPPRGLEATRRPLLPAGRAARAKRRSICAPATKQGRVTLQSRRRGAKLAHA